MRNKKHLFLIIGVLVAAIFLTFLVSYSAFVSSASEDKSYPKIHNQTMLLVLELQNGQVSLKRATKLNRQFKEIGEKKAEAFSGDIKYEVFSDQNKLLYTGLVSNPALLHYDRLDEQGNLTGGVIEQDSALFIVKAPYHKNTRMIHFKREISPAGGQFLTEENLGSIDLSRLQFQSRIIPAGFGSATPSYVTHVEKILNNGDSTDKIDIVLLGDGYTSNQISPSYYAHVDQFLAGFSSTAPFNSYTACFNIWRVDVVSNQSGADHPCNSIYVNTALDASYGPCEITRALTVNDSKAFEAAASVLDEGGDIDSIIVLVNDSEYGGTGGSVAVYSAGYTPSGTTLEIAMHEFGHTLGVLADEYEEAYTARGWFGSCVSSDGLTYIDGKDLGSGSCSALIAAQPNVTAYNKNELIAVAAQQSSGYYKWSYWLGYEGVDCYEGAMYCKYGLFRPLNICKMRELGRDFCPVCREKIIKRIFDSYDPNLIESFSPVPPTPDTVYNTQTTFSVTTPDVSSIGSEWYLDGNSTGKTGFSFDFTGVPVGPGQHTLTAWVTDNSEWIRVPGKIWSYVSWKVVEGDTIPPTIDGPYIGQCHDRELVDGKTFGGNVEMYWSHFDPAGINTNAVAVWYMDPNDNPGDIPFSVTQYGGSFVFPAPSLSLEGWYTIGISVSDKVGNSQTATARVDVTKSDTCKPQILYGGLYYYSSCPASPWAPVNNMTFRENVDVSMFWLHSDDSGGLCLDSGINTTTGVSVGYKPGEPDEGGDYIYLTTSLTEFGGSFGFPINSSSLANGNYTIKIIVYDKSETPSPNYTEVKVLVHVQKNL